MARNRDAQAVVDVETVNQALRRRYSRNALWEYREKVRIERDHLRNCGKQGCPECEEARVLIPYHRQSVREELEYIRTCDWAGPRLSPDRMVPPEPSRARQQVGAVLKRSFLRGARRLREDLIASCQEHLDSCKLPECEECEEQRALIPFLRRSLQEQLADIEERYY